MTMLEGFYGLQVTASVIVPAIFAFTSISWVAVPVSGVAILVVSILAMVAVWGSAVLIMDQMRTWWSDHQDAIVCQLYNSGDAATALVAIGDNIEDAIQAIEWGALLPFAGPLGDALGAVLGVFQNNSLVNPLFKLITGVVLIEVECPCETSSAVAWHFDADAQYWTWWENAGNNVHGTSIWQPSPSPVDPADRSAGCLQTIVDLPAGSYSWYEGRWQLPGSALASAVAHTGNSISADITQNGRHTDVKSQLKIVYTDASVDYANYPPGAWGNHRLYVSAGNNNKTISYICLGVAPSANDRLEVIWRFDNVKWLLA
jgi:hypothetical protein